VGAAEIDIPGPVRDHVACFRDGLGLAWLRDLPAIVAECRQRWSVALQAPCTYPSLSYVAPGVRSDGSPVVLKVGFLYDELAAEMP
jgi:hypothetical protein